MGHDHVVEFASTTGAGWLWTVLVLAAVTAAAGAFLRPVLPDLESAAQRAVAAAAAAVVVAELLLAGALALPEQLVAVLVLAAVVAVGTTGRPAGRGWARAARLAAPWVVAAAAGAALVATALGLVHTGLFLGGVGLAWLGLARPRSRRAAAAVHGAGWATGLAVLSTMSTAAVAAAPS